jgi:putative PIN family toxin of toxin-antitoxin system
MNMPKVVFDTNIIVSALLTADGPPAFIWDEVKAGGIQAFCSDKIYAEYGEVLHRPKFPFTKETTEATLDVISLNFMQIFPEVSSIPFSDESDRSFYDTAITAGATLVTGNIKHYPDSPYVATPAEFSIAYINLKLGRAAFEDTDAGR